MKKKSPKPPRKSILHDVVLVPITDPVKLADLERRCRVAEKMLAGDREFSSKPKGRKGR